MKGSTIRMMVGIVVFGIVIISHSSAASLTGALVLQFDDGYSSWLTDAAPLLARYHAKATGFVCDQYVRSGRITLDDLRALQNEFGWEIGTHTARHISAIRIARKSGAQKWVDEELRPSLEFLSKAGLRVHSLAFPFNDESPELAACVRDAGLLFRDASMYSLAQSIGPTGAFPGVSMDTVKWIPWPDLKSRVDTAVRDGAGLFLYGHRVLPDDAFVEARVVRVEANALELDAELHLPTGEPLALAPDLDHGRNSGPPFIVRAITGNVVQVEGGDLRSATAPGRRVLVGPSYGTRISDLERLLEYAAPRLRFMTVHEFACERSASKEPPEKPDPAIVGCNPSAEIIKRE